ncbi:anhydro-N-acetylmuramic acid kinase [Pseudotenacibaculum sp. MALMAid0570]|uniref:anhydro-N-acetylmuramic acid kinase n=1 Tax=Pseudotenacibaculum sp. MALMAid0570 TaxID=3143938 RepID=UPI0032DE5FFF
MNKNETYAIGLMSGTSLDGLDIVYVKFNENETYGFQVLAFETITYSPDLREQLKNSISLKETNLIELDKSFGHFIGVKTNDFIQKNKIENLDFIASHGHTVFHQPEEGFTKQIGNGQLIADITKRLVVCDFRTQDVELGGQGAPLVPIGDKLLFSNYSACVNLGGFANISFEKQQERIAFDICPVNIVLNYFSQKLGYEYDNKGELSSKGKIDLQLLEKLNSIDFYSKDYPKSLGVEWVNDKIFPHLTKVEEMQTILRTFTEHIAIQIANNIRDFDSVLFTGGGVFNDFLIGRIKKLVNTKIVIPSSTIINYKEALIFALLGLLKLRGKTNCLASVTGAKRNHSSGKIFHAN